MTTSSEAQVSAPAKDPGSSPYGWSKQSKYLFCGRYATLLEQLREASAENEETSEALGVGKSGHSVLEHWYRGEGIAIANADHPDTQEALRVLKPYLETYKPADFGEVLAVEKTLPEEVDHPDFELKCGTVAVNLGLKGKVSCRSDLVVRLSQSDCDHIRRTREVDVAGPELTPGIWIIDHKFYAKRWTNAAQIWANDTQMALNYLLWNNSQAEPAQGVIVNVLYKYKKPAYELFVVKPNTDQITSALAAVRHAQYVAADSYLSNAPNVLNCYNFGKPCRFLDVACRRF